MLRIFVAFAVLLFLVSVARAETCTDGVVDAKAVKAVMGVLKVNHGDAINPQMRVVDKGTHHGGAHAGVEVAPFSGSKKVQNWFVSFLEEDGKCMVTSLGL